MAILETAMTGAGGLLSGCKNGPKRMYEMVNRVHGNSGDIDYRLMCEAGKSPPEVSGFAYEEPTKDNILALLRNGVSSGEYSLVVMYLADHGSGSYIGTKAKGKLYGTEIADVIAQHGDPDTRVFFMCDCCHSAGMAPFAAAKGAVLQKPVALQSIFDRFDEIAASYRKMKSSGKGFSAQLASNPSPKFLGWYNSGANEFGLMDSDRGMEWLYYIAQQFDPALSYEAFWQKLAKPFYYWDYYCRYKDGSDYVESHEAETIGFYSERPSADMQRQTEDAAKRICQEKGREYLSGSLSVTNMVRKNYNGNFDEQVQIFT